MVPPPQLPTRKVSALVAMFENAPPPTLPPATAAPPARAPRRSSTIFPNSSQSPSSPLASSSSSSITPPTRAASIPVVPAQEKRPKLSKQDHAIKEPAEKEEKMKLSSMDWTPRSRDATPLQNPTLGANARPGASTSTSSPATSTSTSSPTPSSNETKKPVTTVVPLRNFKPQRKAPTPPAATSPLSITSSDVAPALVVPTNVVIKGGENKLMGSPKKEVTQSGGKDLKKKDDVKKDVGEVGRRPAGDIGSKPVVLGGGGTNTGKRNVEGGNLTPPRPISIETGKKETKEAPEKQEKRETAVVVHHHQHGEKKKEKTPEVPAQSKKIDTDHKLEPISRGVLPTSTPSTKPTYSSPSPKQLEPDSKVESPTHAAVLSPSTSSTQHHTYRLAPIPPEPLSPHERPSTPPLASSPGSTYTSLDSVSQTSTGHRPSPVPLQNHNTSPLKPASISFSSPPSTPRKLHSTSPPSTPHHQSHVSSPLITPSQNGGHHHHYPRPGLSRAASSVQTTYNLPAYTVFKPGSDPLLLPELDVYLDRLDKPVFSQPEKILSKEEKERWKEWVRVAEPGFWAKTWGTMTGWSSGKKGYTDLEKDSITEKFLQNPDLQISGGDQKKFIFPPMDMVPDGVTVTDLKQNRTTPPPFFNKITLVSSAIDGIIGGEGSTYGITYENAESFRDLMQMISLLLVGASNTLGLENISALKIIFVTIPSILSLDFVSAFGHAIIWLWVFTLLTLVAVYELWRFTGGFKTPSEKDLGEGLDGEGSNNCVKESGVACWRDTRGYKTGVTFFVTTMYLPLSKISIGALAWSSDYWALPYDPYTLYGDNPVIPPLGPADEFYAPLDFCYKTTMRIPSGLNYFNWAWVIVVVAALTVVWLTCWLPWHLYRVVEASVPKVDKYTELGELRTDVAGEYQRLLVTDKSPFSFLYQDYRRPWASFKAIYMAVKLVNILLVVLLTKDNCIFRSKTSNSLDVIRQSSLLGFMALFLLASIISHPFSNTISNNSDRVSRVSYVIMALLGLLVALNVPGDASLGGWVLLTVNILAYTFNGYFTIIGTEKAQSYLKRAYYRLSFSIDLFSPHVDVAKHVARRIWQESLSVILLAGAEFKMPSDEVPSFTEDSTLPPQLINFRGSAAERHVENLKILRQIGLQGYSSALEARFLDKHSRVMQTRQCIQAHYSGPDVYWKNPRRDHPTPLSSYFGRLDVVPFPFICVFRYDEDPSNPIQLPEIDDLELLARQNETEKILACHRVRMCLRAMDNQLVYAPYSETKLVGRTKHTSLEARVYYQEGILRIKRNSNVTWRGYNYSSGFKITISYSDGEGIDAAGNQVGRQSTTIDGDVLGISPDFKLTSSIAKLLRRNRALIDTRIPLIESLLGMHRDYFAELAATKHRVLSHAFLFNVVAADELSRKELANVLGDTEDNGAIQKLTESYRGAVQYTVERMSAVNAGVVNQWWFCLFDDIWRRNAKDIPGLQNQPASFSPHYRTSICYRPMSRPKLEAFLRERDFWTYDGKYGFFNSGFLNKIYFYLDEQVFARTALAVPIHLDSGEKLIPWNKLEKTVQGGRRSVNLSAIYDEEGTVHRPSRITVSSHDTGGGTDHDDPNIHLRSAFPWEDIFLPPPVPWVKGRRLEWIKDRSSAVLRATEKWFGLHPLQHRVSGQGVTFDLRKGKDGWELPRGRRSVNTESF